MTEPARQPKPKRKYDIFVSAASKHVKWLKINLPKLRPFGRVHLASSFMAEQEIESLAGQYDVLHQPRYHSSGYENFGLFCVLDINRLAAAPYFIKVDADVILRDDWIDYVDGVIDEHPEVVLFGPRKGKVDINTVLVGPLVRRKLGRDIEVRHAVKVVGPFYVGCTEFFQRHDPFMRTLHEFLYCFRNGRRIRPSFCPEEWPPGEARGELLFLPKMIPPRFPERTSEDTVRSLVVHAVGATKRLMVIDSQERVFMAAYP